MNTTDSTMISRIRTDPLTTDCTNLYRQNMIPDITTLLKDISLRQSFHAKMQI